MKNLFVIIFFFVISISGFILADESFANATISASSIQDNGQSVQPANAIDNNMGTRWSSTFDDNQWLIIDFHSIKEVVGLQLFWEAAYGKAFTVFVSENSNIWKQVYRTENAGSGLFDDIYFGKYKARYLKIKFTQRGTGWGYSLWEIKIKGANEEFLMDASSSEMRNEPSMVMDADLETMWHSPKDKKTAWIDIDLRKKNDLGGLVIHWSKDFASSFQIQVSDDKKRWDSIYKNDKGAGGDDLININIIHKQYIRIDCEQGIAGAGFGIKEIDLMNWEKLAKKSSLFVVRGLTGCPGFKWNTYVGKDGSFAPDSASMQIGFWVYDLTEKKLYTPETMDTAWSLDQGRLPINEDKWQTKDFKVSTTILADQIDETLIYNLSQIKIENIGDAAKDFVIFVKIQPNPLALIRGKGIDRIEFDGDRIVKINNQKSIFVNALPEKSSDGLSEFAGYKNIQPGQFLSDNNKQAKGIIAYHKKLNKGEKTSLELMVPSSDQNAFNFPDIKTIEFDKHLNKVRQYWSSLIPIKLSIPDKEYEDAFYASLNYMLIMMDKNMIYPGVFAYKTFFLHDAVEMVNALDKAGLFGITEKTLELFNYNEKDGYQDGMGGSIYGIYDHYRITGNESYLAANYNRMIDTCRMIKKKREEKLQEKYKNTPLYGLLPPAVSQDNFTLPVHLYQDNWWAIVGLKSAWESAKVLKKTEDAEWLKKEFEDLKKCTLDSIKKVMEREKIDYMPCFADYWPPSERKIDADHRILGEAQMGSSHRSILFPGQSLDIDIPIEIFQKSYQHYWDVAGKFSGYDGGWYVEYEKLFWGYNAMLAHPLMYVGMEDIAIKNIDWLIQNPSCPRGWMEAMPSRLDEHGLRKIGEGIVGDVPHGWVAGYMVLFIRNMLVREEKGLLYLFSCVPEKWFEQDKEISLEHASTYFGEISFKEKSHIDKGMIEINFTQKNAPKADYLIFSPLKRPIKKAEIDGKLANIIEGKRVKAPALAKKVILYY